MVYGKPHNPIIYYTTKHIKCKVFERKKLGGIFMADFWWLEGNSGTDFFIDAYMGGGKKKEETS